MPSNSEADAKVFGLIKQVYYNRSGVLLLLSVLSAVVMFALALRNEGRASDVYLAIATSLIATTLFAFLQTALTALSYEQVLRRTVEESTEAAKHELLAELRKYDKDRAVKEYAATSGPDRDFNNDLTASLETTSRYTFKGVTGRLAAARLHKAAKPCRDAHLVIAHPQHTRGYESRVAHMISYADTATDSATVTALLQTQICETVVGAYIAAPRYQSLTIDFVSDSQVNRIEIFDNDVYLTLFSETADKGTRYPRTVRFGKESLFYKLLTSETGRVRNNAVMSIRLDSSTTDDQVIDCIRDLGFPEFGAASLRSMRQTFIQTAEDFHNEISR